MKPVSTMESIVALMVVFKSVNWMPRICCCCVNFFRFQKNKKTNFFRSIVFKEQFLINHVALIRRQHKAAHHRNHGQHVKQRHCRAGLHWRRIELQVGTHRSRHSSQIGGQDRLFVANQQEALHRQSTRRRAFEWRVLFRPLRLSTGPPRELLLRWPRRRRPWCRRAAVSDCRRSFVARRAATLSCAPSTGIGRAPRPGWWRRRQTSFRSWQLPKQRVQPRLWRNHTGHHWQWSWKGKNAFASENAIFRFFLQLPHGVPILFRICGARWIRESVHGRHRAGVHQTLDRAAFFDRFQNVGDANDGRVYDLPRIAFQHYHSSGVHNGVDTLERSVVGAGRQQIARMKRQIVAKAQLRSNGAQKLGLFSVFGVTNNGTHN